MGNAIIMENRRRNASKSNHIMLEKLNITKRLHKFQSEETSCKSTLLIV